MTEYMIIYENGKEIGFCRIKEERTKIDATLFSDDNPVYVESVKRFIDLSELHRKEEFLKEISQNLK